MLNVSIYVTRSLSVFACAVCLHLRFFKPHCDSCVRGLCVVTSFVVVMSCSIPSFQLAHALLMCRRVSGVRGMRVSSVGCGTVVLWVVYSAVVDESRVVRYFVI